MFLSQYDSDDLGNLIKNLFFWCVGTLIVSFIVQQEFELFWNFNTESPTKLAYVPIGFIVHNNNWLQPVYFL